jgi:hypothetical protein
VDLETTGTREGNDVEIMREKEGLDKKQNSKSVRKRTGRNIQFLGNSRVCFVTFFLLRPGGGVVMLMQM